MFLFLDTRWYPFVLVGIRLHLQMLKFHLFINANQYEYYFGICPGSKMNIKIWYSSVLKFREQLIKPQLWPDPVAASPYVVDVTSPSTTQHWMRSSTSGTPPYLQPSPPASGWGDFVKKTRNVAADLLNVPPPGWKPPKQPQPHRPPPPVPRQPSVIRRVASQIRNELLNPPQPFPQQPRPAKPTGTKPKQTR